MLVVLCVNFNYGSDVIYYSYFNTFVFFIMLNVRLSIDVVFYLCYNLSNDDIFSIEGVFNICGI